MSNSIYDNTDIYQDYDRSRVLSPEVYDLWSAALTRNLPAGEIRTIVDLGCGTGRFTTELAECFSAKVYGVELSQKMLTQAVQNVDHPGISWLRGDGQNLPLSDGSVDLVFLSMAYHHFTNPGRALGEISRILHPGGYFCLRTSTIENMGSYLWPTFFPTARKMELDRLPNRQTLLTIVPKYGFSPQVSESVRQPFAVNLAEYCDKISLRGLSSLKAISDDEFSDGRDALLRYCFQEENDGPVFEEIDLFVFCRDE